MTLYGKIKWALGILMVFIIILATNLIDNRNFYKIRNSIETIYEDRIIANDLIFEMADALHHKELAFVMSDTSFYRVRNDRVNSEIQDYLRRYNETKLTDEEARVLSRFKKDFRSLMNTEQKYVASDFRNQEEMADDIQKLKDDLGQLSKIQLKEGKRQMSLSDRAIDSIELFTQIEIILLVALAVIIQIIVLYQPKEG